MSLNIKDPEVHRLAQAIARETGESMTHIIREALRERFVKLERHKDKASLAELTAIAKRAAAYVKSPYLDHAEELYNEHGLPK